MSAATAVFIGLWQRLGQLLGRESVGETTSKANCRGSGQRSRRENGAASLIKPRPGPGGGRPTSKCHCQARRGGLNRQQPLTRAAALDQEAKKAATARGLSEKRSAPAATRSRAAAHFSQEPASRSRSTVSGRAPRQRETTPRSVRGPGVSPARPSTGTTTPTRHRPARHASPSMMTWTRGRANKKRTPYHAIPAGGRVAAQSIATCVEINQ